MNIKTFAGLFVGFVIWWGIKFAFPDASFLQRGGIVTGVLLTLWLLSLVFKKSDA